VSGFAAEFVRRASTPSDIWEFVPLLCARARDAGAPVVVELGTRQGNSTAAFLAAAEDCGAGHVVSVDVDPAQVPEWWHSSKLWTFIRGDDRDEGVFDAVKSACGGRADVLFIDTSHEYEHTVTELGMYVPLVKPGGVVLMHDTEWYTCDVARALDDWCPEHGFTWINHPGCNGLGEFSVPEG
jgi:cephalosporin hydroxylase